MREIRSGQGGLFIRDFYILYFLRNCHGRHLLLTKVGEGNMSTYKDMEQIITHLEKVLRKYPVLSLIVVAALGVLLFLSSVEVGRSIGDSIWG